MTTGGKAPPLSTMSDVSGLARALADGEMFGNGWLVDPDLVDPAYSETIAAIDLQTALPPLPPPTPPPPEWLLDLLRGIGWFFQWAAPGLRIALWGAAALLALFLLYRLVPAFAALVDRWRQRGSGEPEEEVGLAEANEARARLADADALARAGRYAEAVHQLLYRSVDDIAARRPGLVRPALTSRDLAASEALPGVARNAFVRIARAVELSLFGGQSVDAGVWEECRNAYAELTIPKNWVGV